MKDFTSLKERDFCFSSSDVVGVSAFRIGIAGVVERLRVSGMNASLLSYFVVDDVIVYFLS